MDFPDKWAAIVWMCRNQLGRRNVTPAQRDYLLKEEHDALVKTHGAADGFRGNQYVKVVNGQNDQLPNSSGEIFQARKVVAKEHGFKESEVRRAVEFGRGLDAADAVSPGIKEAVLSEAVKAHKKVGPKLDPLDRSKIGPILWGLIICCEFNNNSTPIQKVQLFYSTIQNDETEKPSNINTLWNIRKRYKTGISELITRRP